MKVKKKQEAPSQLSIVVTGDYITDDGDRVEKSFTLRIDPQTGRADIGDETGAMVQSTGWTLDELNEDVPEWFAAGHSLTRDEAIRLAQIVSVEYSERFRLEIGVAIQLTVEHLIHGQNDPFAALESRINYQDIGGSLDALVNTNHRSPAAAAAAAAGVAGALEWHFGKQWRATITAKIARRVRSWIASSKRKRGRPESEVIVDFYGALFDTVHAHRGTLSLPSNEGAEARVTPVMTFCIACAQKARSIGEQVIKARRTDSCPATYRMTLETERAALTMLKTLELSNRALCDRLRPIRQETEIKSI